MRLGYGIQWCLLPAVALLMAAIAVPAVAQLSPGDLARPHAGLEGMANCVSCHELGEGPSDRLCLDCHAEIDQACRDAIKNAILSERTKVNASELLCTLKERREVHKGLRG